MSDPSSSSGARFPGGFRRALSMKKSRSDAETVDAGLEQEEEVVVAGTFQDGMHSCPFLHPPTHPPFCSLSKKCQGKGCKLDPYWNIGNGSFGCFGFKSFVLLT